MAKTVSLSLFNESRRGVCLSKVDEGVLFHDQLHETKLLGAYGVIQGLIVRDRGLVSRKRRSKT